MPGLFNRLRTSPALQALVRATGSHEIMSGLGGLYGMASTRSLPHAEKRADGSTRYVFDTEGDTPVTLGDVQIMPRDATARTRQHEDTHSRQSAELGSLYPLLSALGGEYGALEGEAYGNEPAVAPDAAQAERDDAASSRYMSSEIERRRAQRGPVMRFLAGLAEQM